jgi:hypothetical protein
MPSFAPRPRSQPSRQRQVHLPAPIGGVNTVSSGVDMPKTDCVYCYNMIGAEFGLRSRLGWSEWCTNLGTPGEQVRSILPFTGSASDGSNDKLFACTTTGIWDVTSSTAAPSKVVTFGTQSTDSGWGISTVFVNAAHNHFLIYCDEANGYYSYAETGSVWTAGGISGTPITGADPTKLVSVIPWKNRLWFVEKNSAKAWYLAIGAVSGAATAFQFGSRFKAGGDLRNLFSWTFGLTSIDDALVAISSGGDVVIYQGSDPSSASTFGLQGVGYIGGVPAYRRLATDFGGELIIMCSRGIIPASKVASANTLSPSQYQTGKVSNLWNQLQAATSTLRGWGMHFHPQDAALIVTVPTATGQATQQLAMSLSTEGWSQYRDMPMGVCAEPWKGDLYFGTEDGRVCKNAGYVDGVTLAAPTAFSTIDWSILTAFSNLGTSNKKQIQEIITQIQSQGGAVLHKATIKYDWNTDEPPRPTGVAVAGAAVWDTGLWDTALWGGSYQPIRTVFGATGIGTTVALALRGSSSSRVTFTGVDVTYDEGGPL